MFVCKRETYDSSYIKLLRVKSNLLIKIKETFFITILLVNLILLALTVQKTQTNRTILRHVQKQLLQSSSHKILQTLILCLSFSFYLYKNKEPSVHFQASFVQRIHYFIHLIISCIQICCIPVKQNQDFCSKFIRFRFQELLFILFVRFLSLYKRPINRSKTQNH